MYKITEFFKKYFLVFLIFLALFVGILIGRQNSYSYNGPQIVTNITKDKPQEIDFSLFWQTWNKIEEKYIGRKELNQQEMVYGAISGLVSSLGDPYSMFMNEEDTDIFNSDIDGTLEGIGAEIAIKDDVLTIVSPLENSPAQHAGIQAGDKILQVNDTITAGMTIEEAVKIIRGPKGTEVTLTIFREGMEGTKEITITRDTINIPATKLEFKDNNIAYIKIYQFNESAEDELQTIKKKIVDSNTEKIILDLRNNPGGYLEIAVDIAGYFLGKNQTVAIENFGNGKETVYRTSRNNSLGNYPIVILVNEGSASASEILAGALRDNKGVQLIGQTTFGKGSVQQLINLKKGSTLKLSIAKWLTPNKQSITETGLTPDIEVEMTLEDYEADRDPQLEKAIEILMSS